MSKNPAFIKESKSGQLAMNFLGFPDFFHATSRGIEINWLLFEKFQCEANYDLMKLVIVVLTHLGIFANQWWHEGGWMIFCNEFRPRNPFYVDFFGDMRDPERRIVYPLFTKREDALEYAKTSLGIWQMIARVGEFERATDSDRGCD